jgi:ATP-dependent exoDNAse (exonuclease V) beta subunit
MRLSAAQQAAVTRSGQDACVVAGPGSGKTRVLVEHFAWLVEQGISPLRILAITFTEKAANEIKQRLVKRFEHAPDARVGIERAYVSTIHGFCARLLRENAVAAGIDPEFAVQEDVTGRVDPLLIAEEALDALFAEQPARMCGLLEAFADGDLAREIVNVYDDIRTAGVGAGDATLIGESGAEPALESLHAEARVVLNGATHGWNQQQLEYLAPQREWARALLEWAVAPRWRDALDLLTGFYCDLRKVKVGSEIRAALTRIKKELLPPARSAVIGALFGGERQLLREALVRFDSLYRAGKRAVAVLDFADLEEQAIRVLSQRGEVRARVQQSFDAILMDELQDTNPLQWQLMDLLRRPDRFFAVGDINQSIYGFRHAEPDVFRVYRRTIEQRGLPVDLLAENYRSRPEIVSTVRRVFDDAPGIEPVELDARGSFTVKTEPSVELIVAATAELEARWVARRVRELEGKLIVGPPDNPRVARFADMAVLVRTAACVEPLAEAFTEYQVPYLQSKGRTFFAAREVLDMLNWLRVLANPRDEVSLAAVLRSPLVGAGDETILRLKARGELWTSLCELDDSMTGLEQGDVPQLLAARELIVNSRGLSASVSPDLLVAHALDDSGYLDGIEARARANIEKFLGMIRNLAAASPGTLSQLMDRLDILRQEQPEPDAPPAEAADAVNVMTIHAAKGLEFPIVFAAALHKGTSKRKPAFMHHAGSGLGARWRDPLTGESVADGAHLVAAGFETVRESREADRLLYVAMTRAAEHLVLSFAKSKRTSPWATLVANKLGVDPEIFDNAPWMADGIRVLRADAAPPTDALRAVNSAAAPLDLERPQVSGQHDSTLTATAVALFEACPRKYFLSRYLGWPEPRAAVAEHHDEAREAPLDATELGQQVHALLAGEPVESPAPEALALAARFRMSELGQRAARAGRVEREFDFLLALDDVIVRGQMDLWFEEGGELILVDYKTDRHEDRAGAYAIQLQLYALALERIRGRLPDRALLCYLRNGHEVEVPLGAAALETARESVRALSRAQDSLEFPLREGARCALCGYFGGACPAGSV